MGQAPPPQTRAQAFRLLARLDSEEYGPRGRSAERHALKSPCQASSIVARYSRISRVSSPPRGMPRVALSGHLPPPFSCCEWPRRLRRSLSECVYGVGEGWHCYSNPSLKPMTGVCLGTLGEPRTFTSQIFLQRGWHLVALEFSGLPEALFSQVPKLTYPLPTPHLGPI